jgi:hypothetical protein
VPSSAAAAAGISPVRAPVRRVAPPRRPNPVREMGRQIRLLLEDAELLAHNFACHRRARLESELDCVLEEVERWIEALRALDREHYTSAN